MDRYDPMNMNIPVMQVVLSEVASKNRPNCKYEDKRKRFIAGSCDPLVFM